MSRSKQYQFVRPVIYYKKQHSTLYKVFMTVLVLTIIFVVIIGGVAVN